MDYQHTQQGEELFMESTVLEQCLRGMDWGVSGGRHGDLKQDPELPLDREKVTFKVLVCAFNGYWGQLSRVPVPQCLLFTTRIPLCQFPMPSHSSSLKR